MKTSELTGAALDWAVAKAWQPVYSDKHLLEYAKDFHPSTNWAQGGAIIEREGITVKCQGLHWLKTPKSNPESAWVATLDLQNGGEHGGWLEPSNYTGSTPLIAAMRCYVASKLGDEVEIPKELT